MEKNSTHKTGMHIFQHTAPEQDAAGNKPFADLSQFEISLLSLPYSKIERVFSQMNIVKTKLRNSPAVKTLNAILYVRFGLKRVGKCCYSYTVPEDVLRCIGTVATQEC